MATQVPEPIESEPVAPVAEDVTAQAAKAGAASLPFRSAEPSPWMAPHLQDNGLPAGVSRFNWGAFLLAPIWAFAYGLTRWALIAFAINVLGNNVTNLVPDSVALLIGIGQLAFTVWFAFNINRAYWASNPKMLTVEEFNRKQPKWIGIGALFFLVVFGAIFFMALT